MTLWHNYGVKEIYGIQWGYRGFYEKTKDENGKDSDFWLPLNPGNVSGIHNKGGTILGSSRGGFDAIKICDELQKRGINQLYCIGGDGTHRGIDALSKELLKRKQKVALVGIPKTIDNDIPLIDKSFGYDTACEAAEKVIEAANNEA